MTGEEKITEEGITDGEHEVTASVEEIGIAGEGITEGEEGMAVTGTVSEGVVTVEII